MTSSRRWWSAGNIFMGGQRAMWATPRFPLISASMSPTAVFSRQIIGCIKAGGPSVCTRACQNRGHFFGIFPQVFLVQFLAAAREEAHSRGGYQTPAWQRTFVLCTSCLKVSYWHTMHPAPSLSSRQCWKMKLSAAHSDPADHPGKDYPFLTRRGNRVHCRSLNRDGQRVW